MYPKIIGAVLVIACCGSYGMLLANGQRKEVVMLHQLIRAISTMVSELEYRLTPLPELCRIAGDSATMPLQRTFHEIADALSDQVFPDVRKVFATVLQRNKALPKHTSEHLLLLGQTLGKFDLPGQLRGLELCKQEILHKLNEMERNQQQRLRSYQTLGFCAGAALAILLF